MTTILDAVRNLDAAHARGEVDAQEYSELRRSLMALVEDAEVIEDTDTAKPEPVPEPEAAPDPDTSIPNRVRAYADRWAEASIDPWKVGLLIAGLLVCTILALTWIFGDETLAFTLSTVTLAVVVIRAAQYLEEMEDCPPEDSEDEDRPPEETA